MAQVGLEAAVRADIAVGITGSISRVDPNNLNSIPGVIYVAVNFHGQTNSQIFNFMEGERWEIKEKAIGEALKMVLEILDTSAQTPQSF